jgi:hypothetical protein
MDPSKAFLENNDRDLEARRQVVVDGPARNSWEISSADLPQRVDRDLEARRQVVVDGPARNSWEISSADLPQRARFRGPPPIAERDWTAKPPVSDADVINYERQIGVPKGMRYEDMENMSEKDYKKAEEKRRKWDEKQIKKIPKLSSDQKKKMDQASKELLKTYDPMQSLMDSMAADPLDMKNRKDPNAGAGGAVKFFTDSDGRVRPMK